MTDITTDILLCPGQGAQHAGMGRGWHEASEAARAVFARADDLLGFELSKTCFDGPAERIDRTDVAQAAIYVTSAACCEALRERGELGEVVATAGLSLGEYTALHLAGAVAFDDGLKLVQLRGRFMQEAAEASESGMVALIGCEPEQARALCEEAAGGEVLVPANFNCPGQVVISGAAAACERALAVAEKMGLRAAALAVAGAFHSPLMAPAAERMALALDEVQWAAPRVPVLSNVTGKPHGDDPAEIKRLLVEQITQPVRWSDNVGWLLEHTTGRYVELAPGKVLSGLMRRIDRKTKVDNRAEPA